jgi:hypothetical protein
MPLLIKNLYIIVFSWKEDCVELCTGEDRRRRMWWKKRVCKLMGARKNNEQGICLTCSKEED